MIGWGVYRNESPSYPGGSDSHANFEAVLRKAAVGIRTLTVGRSKTRCAPFCRLDSVDKFHLLLSSRHYAKSFGLFSHFGHCHLLISHFDCMHILPIFCPYCRGSAPGGTHCQFAHPVRHFCTFYFGCFHTVRYELSMNRLPNQERAKIRVPQAIFSDKRLFWKRPQKKMDSVPYIGPLITLSLCRGALLTGHLKDQEIAKRIAGIQNRNLARRRCRVWVRCRQGSCRSQQTETAKGAQAPRFKKVEYECRQ